MPRFFLLLIMCCIVLNTNSVSSAVFHLSEVATPDMGVAGAGSAAVARDAATAYFNPAAMTLLCRNQLLVGVQTYTNGTSFSQDSNTPISGRNGMRPSKTLPSGAIYFVVEIAPRFKFGFTFNSPDISYLHYSRNWAGRFLCQKDEFYTFHLNPSFAWKINNHWSFGGGLSLQYALLRQRFALNPSLYKAKKIDAEGTIKDKFDRGAWGYNLGALFVLNSATRFGLAWRSKQTHKLKGLPTYTPPTITPDVTVDPTLNAKVLSQALIPQNNIISVPASLTLSGYHALMPHLRLLVSGAWNLWHEFRKTIVTSNSAGLVKMRRHWHDTFSASLGIEFCVMKGLTLQTGTSIETAPTQRAFRQSPDFPVGKQKRFGAGAYYDFRCMRVGVAAEYLHWSKPRINNNFLKGSFKHNDSAFINLTFTKLF